MRYSDLYLGRCITSLMPIELHLRQFVSLRWFALSSMQPWSSQIQVKDKWILIFQVSYFRLSKSVCWAWKSCKTLLQNLSGSLRYSEDLQRYLVPAQRAAKYEWLVHSSVQIWLSNSHIYVAASIIALLPLEYSMSFVLHAVFQRLSFDSAGHGLVMHAQDEGVNTYLYARLSLSLQQDEYTTCAKPDRWHHTVWLEHRWIFCNQSDPSALEARRTCWTLTERAEVQLQCLSPRQSAARSTQ